MRSNRKWCKRRGSSLECQNCFFVYPIIDSNLKNLANTLKKICKRAEIPEYNLHALRHTFATNLIRQTHNMGEIKEAAEIIGDNYEVIMRTYVHTDSERKVSLIDAMIA